MQFVFIPDKGTTDAMLIMRQVKETHGTKKNKLYFDFVDLGGGDMRFKEAGCS